MRNLLLILLIGIISGIIDILPMLKMKLDIHSVASAFIFYLIMPFIILNINLFGMAWWLKGAITAVMMAVPIIILVAKTETKSVIPMLVTAVVMGTIISLAGHFLNISQ
jgi:hypothetical protein